MKELNDKQRDFGNRLLIAIVIVIIIRILMWLVAGPDPKGIAHGLMIIGLSIISITVGITILLGSLIMNRTLAALVTKAKCMRGVLFITSTIINLLLIVVLVWYRFDFPTIYVGIIVGLIQIFILIKYFVTVK